MTLQGNIQYRRLFKASPDSILVLSPQNFEIIAVTDEYLRATNKVEADIVEKKLVEVFPYYPNIPHSDLLRNLSASLQRVQSLKTTDIMGPQRYPVRLSSGVFEDRFWSPVNIPVLDESGEIEFIMHRVHDVCNPPIFSGGSK